MSEVRWVNSGGYPSPGKVTDLTELRADVNRVILGGNGKMELLALRDPSDIRVGEIHPHIPKWEYILKDNPSKPQILQWLEHGVDIKKFMRPFKGTYKGASYDSSCPPRRISRNHGSCKKFASFITETLLNRIRTGAVCIWGNVG